jgi:hypothetical protein
MKNHPSAQHDAEAAKSLPDQNKFWEMQIIYMNINKHLDIYSGGSMQIR